MLTYAVLVHGAVSAKQKDQAKSLVFLLYGSTRYITVLRRCICMIPLRHSTVKGFIVRHRAPELCSPFGGREGGIMICDSLY